MASPVRIGRTVRAATITVILAAFAVLPGCLHDDGEGPNPLVFTGPSAPVLWGPLPAFVFSPQSPDVGDTVSFDASLSRTDPGFAIGSYTWSFGGGSPPTSTGMTASATYASEGEFTVSLTVTDNRGTTTPVIQRQSVRVGTPKPPVARIVVSVVGNVANFDGITSTTEPGRTIPSTGYAWNFGDNTSGTGATVQHTYTGAVTDDTFNATLTVTDSLGLTGSTSASVQIE